MQIDSGIIVNLDMDIAALLLNLGALVMASRIRINDQRVRIFRIIASLSTVISLTYAFILFVVGRLYHGPVLLVTIVETMMEIAITMCCMYVLYYISYSMYKSNDYLRTMKKVYTIPFVIVLVIDIINMFTGILWYYDSDVIYHMTWLYYVVELVMYGYLIAAILQYIRFRMNDGKVHFLNIWLFLIPVALGSILEDVIGYLTFNYGLAIGVGMLYMGLAIEVGFVDKETGFYNGMYLSYLETKVNRGQFKLSSIITYNLKDPSLIAEFSNALSSMLPEGCETVRIDDNKIITMSETTDRGLVYMLSDDITAICEDLGTEVEVESIIKKKKEEASKFFADNVDMEAAM